MGSTLDNPQDFYPEHVVKSTYILRGDHNLQPREVQFQTQFPNKKIMVDSALFKINSQTRKWPLSAAK